MPEKADIGVIGAGSIANAYHLPALMSVPEARVTAVADLIEERARATAEKFHVERWFTDYRDLLGRGDVDGVVVCTPNDAHCEVAVAAAEAGKHVMVQKPMARTVEECDRMIGAARRAGVRLMACFMHRWFPETLRAKEIIDSGEVGRIVQVRQRNGHGGPGSWFRDLKRAGGGCLIDLGVHGVDLIRWLAGEIRVVFAVTDLFKAEIRDRRGGAARRLTRETSGEDCATVMYRLENGAMAIHDSSWCQYRGGGFPRFETELYGLQGAVHLHTARGTLAVYSAKRGDRWSVPELPEGFEVDPNHRHFADCILHDTEPSTKGEDGRRAIQVVMAAYQSSKTGKPVTLE